MLNNQTPIDRDIAIIGMACRFPDANNPEELFHNLRTGKDSLREISAGRIRSTTLDPDAGYRVCGYLEDIDKFDHAYFNISMGEAKTMDPHQRIMLEVVNEAFEDAGCPPGRLSGGLVSVYVADTSLEYYKHADEFQPTLKTGNVKAFLGAWISKQFDLRGAVAMVDTSCSSSLVAVHLACNDLILGDADYALACGVNLDLFPLADAGPGLDLDSPDGRSHPFSKKANGMSFGEGVACVLLKPYNKAVKDKDIIHAVIKASAVNNNSSRAASLTAPDSITQCEVISRAWEKAGISAAEAGFIEAHGSGTQLGDSIEIGGLDLFFKKHNVKEKTCAISTIKSNIGHTRAVAGLAGLIKAVLSLHHQVLFPLIGFDEPNPLIDFDHSPVFVIDRVQPWEKAPGQARYAGVSSIGLSGTNCHVVLREELSAPDREISDGPCLVPLSAKSLAALENNLRALLGHLMDHPALRLKDIAYTLAEGRTHHPYRVALPAIDLHALREQIAARLRHKDSGTCHAITRFVLISEDHSSISRPAVEYLSDHYPVFKEAYASCLQGTEAEIGAGLADFAFQYSLYQLLKDNGLVPTDIVFYGVGKILRLVLKEEISLEEGVSLALSYEPLPIDHLEARVEKLLEAGSGLSLFFELGIGGEIGTAIRTAGSEPRSASSQRGDRRPPLVLDLSGVAEVDPLQPLFRHLYEGGRVVAWNKLACFTGAKKISLPAYRFDKTRCWIREEPRPLAQQDSMAQAGHLSVRANDGNMAGIEAGQFSFIERKLLVYWKRVLPRAGITVEDNFFETGGDSLKATKLINHINDNLGTRIDFEDIFDYPDIRSLAAFIDASTSPQDKLALYWKEVLETDDISPSDNFFDLGGHSLNASQVLKKIAKELNLDLSFEDFYRHPTLESLAGYISHEIASPGQQKSTAPGLPIGKAPQQEYYALSHAQQRLWLLSQQHNSSVAYNQPEAYRLTGPVMVTALREAFEAVVSRHESLRTTFHLIEGEPRQRIEAPGKSRFAIEIIDVRGEPASRIHGLFNENALTPFDFGTGPLLRVQLLVLGSDEYLLFVNLHHIISDEWSFGILIREIAALYSALRNGGNDPLPPLSLQYKDYCAWHNQLLEKDWLAEHRAYWLKQFEGALPLLDFPSHKKRPSIKTFNAGQLSFTPAIDTGKALLALAKQEGATPFMACLALIKFMLYRYTGQPDIIVGCPVAGRQHTDLDGIIGFFVNLLPLRTSLAADWSFRALLQTVRKTTLAGFDHQVYPFDLLVGELNLERDPARSPLFDVGFTWHAQADAGAVNSMGLTIEEYETGHYTVKTDLWFHGYQSGDALTFAINYNTDLFTQEQMTDFMRNTEQALAVLVGDPDSPLHSVNFLSTEEYRYWIVDKNKTATLYPDQATIPGLFEEQVDRYPEKTALVFKNKSYTYLELNAQVNRLARYMVRHHGLVRGERVGLWVNRNELAIIGLLAILKAGGVYVPVDPEYPTERVRKILADVSPKLILTESCLLPDLPEGLSAEWMALDLWEDDEPEAGQNPLISLSSRDLAYIMYTSGSTGIPKGVCVEHRSVIRLVRNTNYVKFGPDDRLLQIASFAFDGSVFDIFGALLNGAALYILDKESILSSILFVRYVKEYRTNMMFIPTSLFHNLVDTAPECISLFSTIVFGGERAIPAQIRKALPYRSNRNSLVNGYGPTENTTFSACFIVDELSENILSVPVGLPVSNSKVFILDSLYQPVPAGVEGEVYLGGDGLARGYWNNDAATAGSFITISFLGKQERLYKTGDIGKWLPDGNLDLLGRRDHQVKIRGHRIELGEIENLLLDLPPVRSVYLRVLESPQGEKQIVAYLVIDGEQEPSSLSLPDYRQYMERHVPLYMIPSYFIQVPAIPLNVNGKVDEKGLPDPARDLEDGKYEAPSGAIEEELARIWQEQLGVERPGVRDNFFALGGDSIKAIRLISAINVSFNKLLDINDIFTHVDISSLAQRILESDDVILHRKQVAAIRSELNALKQQVLVNPAYRDRIREDYVDIYPMSDIEIGIIYHSLLDRSAGLYHDQLYYQFGEADFSLEDLRKCMGLLVARHELLRTSFHLHGFNFPLQIVHQPPAADPEISLLDLRYLDKEGQQQFLEEYLAGDRNEPFVFTSPGLWRIRVFRLSDREYGLLWVVHHAIIDGWSNASFITELSNGMASIGKDEPFRTGKLKATYKDFIIDQLQYERHSDWRSFWPAYMAAFNRTRLPLQNAGRQTGPVPPAGESVILLNAGLSKALHKISRDRGIGLRELFLAAFTWLLKMTTHSDDITIGLVTNARPVIEDGDKMIGCFLNTVPYRVCLSGRITGAALIDLTHTGMNRLKPHEKISLQKIIELLGPERLGGTDPVFNMAFGYLDFHIYDTMKERTETADQLIGSYTKTNTSLDFVVGKTGDQFSVSLNYAGGLYEEEDIRRLEGYYEKILYHIAFQPDTVLENINIIGEQEKAVLLQQFNLPDLAISNNHTIQELFGTIAAARPGATALVLEEGGITYYRLNELSNQLAHYLRNKCQVGKGQVIALMPDRSEWMVIGMLGILKSGACFLPVDPAYPASRKEYMLTDSGAEILLTAGVLRDNDIPAEIQMLDMRSLALGDEPSFDPSAVSTAQDLAYVLYTSGSTGKPKGAMIGHRNFVNMILYLKEKFSMEAKDRVVQFASVSFDACVYEIFLALLSGAGLILLTSRIIFDLVSFISYLKDKKATVALLPPVYLNKLELGNLHFMRVLVTGGEEAILRDAVSLSRHLDFYNAYGPTECAVIATLYKAGPDLAGRKAVPIGRPIANTCIYILDKEGQLLPVGVEGEICISGDGVGRGYLHAPELTETRFVEDPFQKGVPVFRTGDKGFYHKDGTIEFAGRNDEQLKINGYRIEPEEIRAALMRHPAIRLALVLPATDAAGEKALNAYYHADVALSILQLRQHLEQLLPSYMIPARFIGVEGFPLTNNGKIDVKMLQEIGAGIPADKLEFTSPENEIEENLVKVWRRVLRRDVISVYDNYFELGGSSVKLIEVFNILKKEYAYKIEIADFFKAHTIRLLSRLIEEKNELVPREDNNLEL